MPRPLVTLSYAQSLDGCIAQRRGEPLQLSGRAALVMTHRLRAEHDAILVGIGTALADDPSLTVRLVEGPDPRPVIVDSRLRLPLHARVLRGAPWVATCAPAEHAAAVALRNAGADLLHLPATADGRVHLPSLLVALQTRGIRSLMVEGGARIITAFLNAQLVDRLVLTVAPRLVGGVRAPEELERALPLRDVRYEQLGDDLIVSGVLAWR